MDFKAILLIAQWKVWLMKKQKEGKKREKRPGCDEHAKNEGKERENWNPFCRDFGRGASLHLRVVWVRRKLLEDEEMKQKKL